MDGLMTSFLSSGEGNKTVLLVHGWGDNKNTFDPLIKSLGKGYKYITLDLPGFGDTQKPPSAYGVKEYAQFLAKFCDKIDLKPDVVIGHSNGGAILIESVAENMLNPKQLILLASSGIRRKSTKKNILRLISFAGKIGLKFMPKNKRQNLKKKFYGSIGSDYLTVEGMEDSFKKVVSYDILDQAKKVQMPTLLIYGDSDDSTPVAMGRELCNEMKDSRLEVIENVGHFLHHQKPHEIVTLIKEFIR